MAEAIQQWAREEWKARLVSVTFGKVEDGPGGFPVVPCDVVLEVASGGDFALSIIGIQLDVKGNATAKPALDWGQYKNLRVTDLQKAGEIQQYWIHSGPPSTIEASFRVATRSGVELRQGKETDAEIFRRERCGFWINFHGMTFILRHDGQVSGEISPGIG